MTSKAIPNRQEWILHHG